MRRRILPVRYLLPLAAVALATVAVFIVSGRAIESERNRERDAVVENATASIQDRIAAAEASLHDGVAFINSSELVTHDEFRSYSAAALDRPALRSYGYAERVTRRDRRAWERANGVQINDFSADRELVPAAGRDLYFPTKFVEGPSIVQSRARGFDGFGEPERHAAMLAAARSGRPEASTPVRTPSGAYQPLFYQAVYKPGAPRRSGAERLAALRGFVAAGIDIAELARGAAATLPGNPPLRLYDGDLELLQTDGSVLEDATRSEVNVGGRTWTLEMSVPYDPGAARAMHWALLLVGFALVVVLWRLFDRAVRQTERAERLVEQRTAELADRNDELVALGAFKDRMVGMVSHDLRSPLTAINGYLALLLEEEGGEITDQQRRWLTVSLRSAGRLERQIEDLLLSSHISEGHFELTTSSTDIVRLTRDVVEAAQPAAGQQGIDLSIEAPDSAPIVADERRIAQALDNLVSNAIKYTPDGGRVTVRVTASESSVSLAVTDTGIGMSEADSAAAFEPFARVGEAVDRGIRGTGLGLTIVKGVVEAHGGTVSVHSAPGRGSCFTIELPRERVLAHA